MSALAALATPIGHAERPFDVTRAILIVHDAQASPVADNALDAFARRLRTRTGLEVALVTETEARALKPDDAAHYGLLVAAGVIGDGKLLGHPLTDLTTSPALKQEGFRIDIGENRAWLRELFPAPTRLALVCGQDDRGLLFGLGKLLRLAEYPGTGCSLTPAVCDESPAIAERGVYFATHFNNYYESAPIEEIEGYVEDMAFWGVNSIWTWFDMGWYPEGFWNDPQSKGMQLLARIRRINDKARSLGLTVGLTAIANEGFKNQPSKDVVADMSEKRGGYYPDSTICPSKPGGMDMILADRRKVLELVGPIDVYITWPFDQGSCGCPQCRPWTDTFMRISQDIAVEVRRQNPKAKILLSTWYFKDDEMAKVLAAMKAGASWFDGVVTEAKWAGTFEPPANYARVVFPEISMEGSLFCGYGASGANPMPTKFLADAKRAAAAGYGAALYSEGIYEDVNKVVWISGLWNPRYTVEDVVREYARFYFGPANADAWTKLVLGLEQTWPPQLLPTKDAAEVQRLTETATSLGAALPALGPARMRWQYFMDRAEMDWRMVRIGSDAELLRESKTVLTDTGYVRDPDALRRTVQAFRDKVAARAEAVAQLFEFHWQYLERAHLDRTTALLLTPPDFIGQRDWDRLQAALDAALQESDGDKMRVAVLRGFKEWFWHNNITLDYVYF